MGISQSTVLRERLRRQRLTDPLTSPEGYVALFRSLQPVSTIAMSRPGNPPSLFPRTRFDDDVLADRMRARRDLIKGRFLGGRIGYVLADDLELYANAFRRPIPALTETQWTVLEAVRNVGPLTPRQVKAETDLLNKYIMPALHRLQKAFLVYEDQIDSDWERSWYDFGAEWPDIELDDRLCDAAVTQVLLRFFEVNVFATFEQIRDWLQLPKRSLARVVQAMEVSGATLPCTVEGLGEGWVRAQDASLRSDVEGTSSVFMLNGADALVRSHTSELKRRFGAHEVLQYLLIDGVFCGAVLGHWRIGPHDVSDILVTLRAEERMDRRDEIVSVVAAQYHPPHSRILRYDGKPLHLHLSSKEFENTEGQHGCCE
jgi:winged helix DNA-binding protein